MGASEWDWNANELWINVGEDPDDGIAEAGTRDLVVLLNSRSYITMRDLAIYGCNSATNGSITWNGSTGASNITLDGLLIEKSVWGGIRVFHSDYAVIQNCTIQDHLMNGLQLIATASGETMASPRITDNTIQNCPGSSIDVFGYDTDERITDAVISGNAISRCGDGIYIHRVDDSLISDNAILDIDSTAGSSEGPGIAIQTGSNNIIERNEIARCWMNGMEVWGGVAPDGPTVANIIRYNEIHDNGDQAKATGELGGIFCSSIYVTDTEIYYNLIYNHSEWTSYTEHGIVGNGSGYKIYNNVLYNNMHNIRGWVDTCDDWVVKNNVLMNPVDMHIQFVAGVTGLDCDNNQYYPDGATRFSWAGTDYNFADWKTNSGQDGSSPDVADPLFTSPTSDFTLQEGSPCRNAGTDVGLIQDYAGNAVPMGAAEDIGAYEYVE